jgi:hypothetical protein
MKRIRFGKYGVVVYGSLCVPRKSAAMACGPLVFIRPRYADDRGLLEHELVHTRQFWNPRKWFKGRLWWEVEAFREQAKWCPEDRSREFARLLSASYGFGISEEEAEKLLKG